MSSYIRMAIKFAATMNIFLYLYLPLEPQHVSLYLQQVIAILSPHLRLSASMSKKSKIVQCNISFSAFVRIPVQLWFKHGGLTV